MKLMTKAIYFSVCAFLFANGYTFISSDSITNASSSMGKNSMAVNQLIDLGIENHSDQIFWSNFVKSCIVPELSQDQLTFLVDQGLDGISKFLQDFSPSAKTTMMAYNHVVSCPEAKPAAQKIISNLMK